MEEKGIITIRHFLESDSDMNELQSEFLINSILFILRQDIFSFNSHIFHQMRDCAMGTRFAPSYENVYMEHFESLRIKHPQILSYRRFIDDLFILWKETQHDALEFVKELNINDWGLAFTPCISNTSIVFLDLEIYKK